MKKTKVIRDDKVLNLAGKAPHASFRTKKWQEEEKRVDREIKSGKIKSAATPKKLFKDLGL